MRDNWEKGFSYLQDFVGQEGHAKVPKVYKTTDGYNLAAWVRMQREIQGGLSFDRKLRLEKLPGWIWDINSDKWEKGFRHLKEFAEREGHVKVPYSFNNADGYRLGAWVTNQRTLKDRMSPERKLMLETLPGWVWVVSSERWEEGFHILKEFAEREGHAKVPAKYKTADGYSLGSWVMTQRTRKNDLTPERTTRLEALPGWVWQVKNKSRVNE